MTNSIFPIIKQALRPDPKISIADFARENYRLPPGSPIEGKFDIEYTPYLKKILECLQIDNHAYEEVIFMKGAQIGATTVGLCLLNYVVGSGVSTNALVCFPTEKTFQRFVKKKFRPMIKEIPGLSKKLNNRTIDRDSLELFSFPGGSISFANANAPNTLRMDSCQYVIFDEVSDFPYDSGQGDPVEIGRARTTAFEGRKKIYLASTPTDDETCRITRGYNAQDVHQHKYFIPCVKCKHFQTIEFKRIKWTKDLKEIYLECESCKCKILEHYKSTFLQQGEWREVSSPTTAKKIGFHLSGLYSPLGMLSWRSVVTQFLASKDDPSLLKVFTNNVLGEPWRSSVQVSQKNIKGLISDYEINSGEDCPQLPKGVSLITAGVDFNEHHTNIEIVGWGKDYQSWGLEYIKLNHHISSPEMWEALDKTLSKTYRHWKQIKLRVACSVLDTGYQADRVYEYIRKNLPTGRNIIGIKGYDGVGKPIISTQPRTTNNKAKIPLYFLSNHTSNETLFTWMNIKGKDAAGRCFFPKSYSETEYFSELTAMRKVTEARRGRLLGRWLQDTNKRCEANDCRRYAMGALFHLVHLGLDLNIQSSELEVYK